MFINVYGKKNIYAIDLLSISKYSETKLLEYIKHFYLRHKIVLKNVVYITETPD